MRKARFQVGDRVLYRRTKFSRQPGVRARNITPMPHGDGYSYNVDKFWVVSAIQPDGRLVVVTRRGKEHVVHPDDPNLRRASWWERLKYQRRFDEVAEAALPHERASLSRTGS